jgi:hypothetical protein
MSEVAGANERQVRRRTRWLALAALACALLSVAIFPFGAYAYLPWHAFAAVGLASLACGLAILLVLRGKWREDWLCSVVCGLAIIASISFLLWSARLLVLNGWWVSAPLYALKHIQGAAFCFYQERGHAPESLEDLVRAGLLVPDSQLQGSRVFLAPLDSRFYDMKLAEEMKGMWPPLLSAYGTSKSNFETGAVDWMYADLWVGRVGEGARTYVLQLVAEQREAISWLDDAFPLADLERIAQTDSGRRAHMGSAILGYRQLQAEKRAAETQKQGP